MNVGRIARVLAGFVVFFVLAQVPPLLMALGELRTPRCHSVAGFLSSIAIGTLTAGILWFAGRRAGPQFFRRETLCVAALAWALASVLGSLPFQWSGLLPDACDALFESVSGLATCGGTVLGSAGNPTPEATPASMLLWRAVTQWLGGIGIVLIFVALLPAGMANKNLLVAESVGVNSEGFQPRLIHRSRWIIGVYVVLTALCTTLLMLVGGMSLFDATCHAFTTLATGGYSTRTSVAAFDHVGAEVVLTVFMYIAGCTFTMLAGVLRDGFRGARALFRTGEFRIYTVFTIAAIGLVTIDLMRGGMGFPSALRQSSLNTVSMLTCCGFATADFHAWPPLSLLVIFTCMMVGGCSGSAAGGMKQVRVLICLRLFAYHLRQFMQPKRVDRIRLDGEVLPAGTISSVLAIVLMWLATIMVGAMVIAWDQRLSFVGALTASASMLGGCGPALAVVHPDALIPGLPELGRGVAVVGPNIGPLGGYGDLAGWTKVAMCLEMVLGRLELLPLLALLMPSFWRR